MLLISRPQFEGCWREYHSKINLLAILGGAHFSIWFLIYIAVNGPRFNRDAVPGHPLPIKKIIAVNGRLLSCGFTVSVVVHPTIFIDNGHVSRTI